MGYVKVGGHPYQQSFETGIDAIYRKLYHLPENENLPDWIISDAKHNSSPLKGLNRRFINRYLRSTVGRAVADQILNEGYVAVYTHIIGNGEAIVVIAEAGVFPGLYADRSEER